MTIEGEIEVFCQGGSLCRTQNPGQYPITGVAVFLSRLVGGRKFSPLKPSPGLFITFEGRIFTPPAFPWLKSGKYQSKKLKKCKLALINL
jgi:hypothetical protein